MSFPFTPSTLKLTDELLKRTTSRCPTCHAPCPAEVWRTGGIPSKVFLKRTCPEHGEASACIASDARFYWLAKGKSENACGCGPNSCCSADGSNAGTLGRNADPGGALGVMEKLSTCLALIEIVNSCNLSCPTCYADSPLGAGHTVDSVPLENLQQRIQGVIDRKGKIEILQLSGGEPTLHPRFFELLRWLHGNPQIDYVLLNTNGVRIAHDESFARELAATFRYGKFQLYLQFDGTQAAGQEFLRGADLRSTRVRCLERCAEMKLPVTLAMTVTPENLPFLWEAIEFGLRWPNVRGISFQPMFQSGRVPNSHKSSDVGSILGMPAVQKAQPGFSLSPRERAGVRGKRAHFPPHSELESLNSADIILAAVEQSTGKLRFDDFTPLPCGDPNCATIGYLLKVGGQVRSVSDFIDFKNVQDFLGTKVRYKLEDLMKCGCESEPLGELLRQFEMDESHTFRLFIKPFMDATSWDEDRIDRCCTHVIRPDGKLDSFCRYYSGFADCKK
jgi:7,8-dihydro-6-hydroxymethylpterin dimethyltransferase